MQLIRISETMNASGEVLPGSMYNSVSGTYLIGLGANGWNLYKKDSKGSFHYMKTYGTLQEIIADNTYSD